ncbi:MAG: DUF2752 domain-containing protein [Verrucomicrobiota bacterium]
MRPVRLERASRRLPIPGYALLLIAVFAGAYALLLSRYAGGFGVCYLKESVGLPCIACRGTRAATSLLHGQPLKAIGFNPLLAIAMMALPLWLMLRYGFGRRVRLAGSILRPWIWWTLFALLLAGNWAYVIWREGMGS